MVTKLTILVVSFNAVGHVNSCAGATSSLLQRGHRVIFLLEESFRGKVSSYGFEEVIYQKEANKHDNPGEDYAQMLLNQKLFGPHPVLEKLENLRDMMNSDVFINELVYINDAVKRTLKDFKPDLIYFDGFAIPPEILYSGIPWILNYSPTPTLFLELGDDDNIPPGGSGFASNGDRSNWNAARSIGRGVTISKKYSDVWESLGYPRYTNDFNMPQNESWLMTVYAWPDVINHSAIRNRQNWFNLEVFHRVTPDMEVPELVDLVPKDFLEDNIDGKFTGKFIYLSMGSMGSIDLQLMNRLIATLCKTNHKYIVLKGPRHEQYNLPRNMWGERYLQQLSILPHCDLVITHGGNNTTTETFARGIPMVILPLFGDQPDNAQRFTEMGYAQRVDPYHYEDRELIEAMERMLYDEEMRVKIKNAAKDIQTKNRHQELAVEIEQRLFLSK